MAAQNVGICFHSLGLGAQFVLWDLFFPWLAHTRLLLMAMKVKLWVSKQVYKCGGMAAGRVPMLLWTRAILLPKTKGFSRYLVLLTWWWFQNITVWLIPESQYEIVFSGFSFLDCSVSYVTPIKSNEIFGVLTCWKRGSLCPVATMALLPFFLLNALTQLQCIEILSCAWLLWLALLCQSSHLHRHFKSVCGAASLRANTCVPSPSCASRSTPVALQGSGPWFWLEPNPPCSSHTQGWGRENWGHLPQSLYLQLSLQAVGRGSAELFNDCEAA